MAEKANKNQVQGFRKVIDEILWNSFKEKRRSSGVNEVGSVIGVSLVAIIRKLTNNYSSGSFANDFNSMVLPQTNELEELESQLSAATAKIQSMNYKELFDRNYPDYTIEEAVGLELKTKLPDWVRNIFIWYGEDKISEDELIGALQFLIKEGMIKV